MFSALKTAANKAADSAHAKVAAAAKKYGPPGCALCEAEKVDTPSATMCVLCSRNFCKKHQRNNDSKDSGITRTQGTRYQIPPKLKASSERAGVIALAEKALSDGAEYVCCHALPGQTVSCKERVVARFMEMFKEHMEKALRVKEFCAKPGEVGSLTYPLPEGVDDSFNLRALKLAVKGGETALGFMSYELLVLGSIALYGVKAKVLVDMLKKSFGIDDGMIELVFSLKQPVIYALRNLADTCSPEVRNEVEKQDYPSIAKNIVPTVFYLSRKHVMNLFAKTDERLRLCDEILTMPLATQEHLDYIAPYFGPANWLYKIKLPGVHSGEEWTKWYLSSVLKKDGWTVVGCSLETEQVPLCEFHVEEDEKNPGEYTYVEDNVRVPAFAVVTRGKEALIVVRGTQSMADWTININLVPEKVTYHKGKDGSTVIEGVAHAGMYKGAKAIIELCGVGAIVDTLVKEGYSIKVVGHSLGAGISCMIAVLLKQKYAEQMARGERSDIPFIPSIGFGHPPCLGVNIADATKEDKLCTAIVNEYDVVCRLSEFNFVPLAEEVFLYRDEATKQVSADLEEFKKYTKSLGAVGRINAKQEENTTDEKSADNISEEEQLPSPPVQQRTTTSEMEAKMRSKLERLCVPGEIIIFGTMADGKIKAALCNHDAKTLKRITLLDTIVDDHDMSEYSNSMREVVYDRQVAANKMPHKESPVHMDAMSESEPGTFKPCSVCQLDVCWPYILKSVASRASATCHCQACGNVCCVVCAPAGDTIPAEAMDVDTLSDRRTPLPSYGKFSPQRVCYPCYFKSHEL